MHATATSSAPRRVLLTGVTSFTGCHIARAYREAGFEVAATLTRERDAYADGLMARRLEHAGINVFFPATAFGTPAFLRTVRDFKPEVFVNHGASIEGYRRADFDYLASLREGLNECRGAMAALAEVGCRAFVHTGSVFEPGEGFGPDAADHAMGRDTDGLSIYGVSKAMAWQALRYFAREAGLPLGKVVIPNPIGRFENEDRLVPFCVKLWRSGQSAKLFAPDLVRDNVPAEWLARSYVRLTGRLLETAAPLLIARPSAFALSGRDFLARFAKALSDTGFAHSTPVEITPKPSSEPLVRVNTDPVPELGRPGEVEKFWNDYATSFG